MAEYIERDAAMLMPILPKEYRQYQTENLDDAYEQGWLDALGNLKNAPAVDVVPVVHSYWESYSCSQYMGTDGWGEPKWRDGRFYICHNYKCRRKTVVKSNYCPNCGAKMDLEVTDG